jgi:hypothetical protein
MVKSARYVLRIFIGSLDSVPNMAQSDICVTRDVIRLCVHKLHAHTMLAVSTTLT